MNDRSPLHSVRKSRFAYDSIGVHRRTIPFSLCSSALISVFIFSLSALYRTTATVFLSRVVKSRLQSIPIEESIKSCAFCVNGLWEISSRASKNSSVWNMLRASSGFFRRTT